ncbi:unnamed protein product [Auanema sp. JU1783]|nr:unnamed protein product [Auanema sp. JU1783]
MPLPRILSEEDNLPPEEGPFDEEAPLLTSPSPAKSSKHVLTSALMLLVFCFLITTVAFAALYFHLRADTARLPKWPKPSLSPLGKYSKAAVAADNEICSTVGRNTLLRGGNAVDAAISTLICIGVMDTHSSGIGGGHFMTIFNGTTEECIVIDAREVAPLAATEDMFKGRWNESRLGWKAVAVPGELHGIWTAFVKYGSRKVTWSSLVEPTIELLQEGYPTSHALAKALSENENVIRNEPTMFEYINPQTKKVFTVGQQIKTRVSFLKTLQVLANSTNPVKEFYEGDLAEKMVAEFKKNGGIITLEDFKSYKSKIIENKDVIHTNLRNSRRICGAPPPAGSAVAQAILSVMDGYEYNTKSFDEIVQFYHHFLESSKFAYAGRSWLGDPNFVANATDIAHNITSSEWADWVRSMITDKTHPDFYYGGSFEAAPEDHGTTHISIFDDYGNAVSVTSTINLHMGAMVTSLSTGVLWNNEMDDFSTPGHANFFGFPPSPANFIRPGKRPMSSQSPLVVLQTNKKNQTKPILAVGGAGGSTIISGVAGVALHALWLKADVKQAIDAPRLHNQLQPNRTDYEPNFPKPYLEALKARGHTMHPVHNLTVVTAVERGKDGQIYANSDFRKGEESASAGY